MSSINILKVEEDISKKRVFVFSNGCVPNKLEGKKIESGLEENGWEITDDINKANFLVINFCGYSGYKIKEAYDFIDRRLKNGYKGKEVILTGCLNKIKPDFLRRYRFIKHFELNKLNEYFGLKNRFDMLSVSGNLVDELETTRPEIFNIITSTGCLGKCTYCAIKEARGNIKSKPINHIIRECEIAIAEGFKKILLWADDLGAYGYDININYTDLLDALVNSPFRRKRYSLFLQRLNIQWLIKYNIRLKGLLKSNKIKLIHSPIQSGSNKILKLMNRNYAAEDSMICFKYIKSINPEVKLRTDIIVGFPEENNEDFEKTLDMIEKVGFDEVLVFKYSGVPGTPAFSMPNQIDEELKELRVRIFWKRFPIYKYTFDFKDSKYWVYDNENLRRFGPFCPHVYL